jgi:hypothetical protein
MPIILQALLISVGINALFFIFAAIIKTDVFTDITYSLTFIVLTISGFLLAGGFSSGLFSTITAALVLIWALRLGSYLFIRILKIKVDHRFDDRRDDPVKFGMFWALQSITVWLVMTPILILLGQGEVAPGALSWIGWGIAIIGLIIETVSDAQKYRFKSRKEKPGALHGRRTVEVFAPSQFFRGNAFLVGHDHSGVTALQRLGIPVIHRPGVYHLPPVEGQRNSPAGKELGTKMGSGSGVPGIPSAHRHTHPPASPAIGRSRVYFSSSRRGISRRNSHPFPGSLKQLILPPRVSVVRV